jgi:hypothetical protein
MFSMGSAKKGYSTIFTVPLRLLVVSLLFTLACRADPLIDLTLFNPPANEQRKIKEPVLEWIIQQQASQYCARVGVKDGFVSRPESCAYWKLAENKCVLVTTSLTSHSELGHLFVACLRGSGSP